MERTAWSMISLFRRSSPTWTTSSINFQHGDGDGRQDVPLLKPGLLSGPNSPSTSRTSNYSNMDDWQDVLLLQYRPPAGRPTYPAFISGRTSHFSSSDLRQDVPLIQHGSLAGRPTSPVRTSGRTSHLSSMDL